mmetsp:Transcript_529/g.1155  ORF Transcript_529/g.1155 Transcript_529/m.1155 type:complete len:123 (-) Transcript_529:2483-2851(-)
MAAPYTARTLCNSTTGYTTYGTDMNWRSAPAMEIAASRTCCTATWERYLQCKYLAALHVAALKAVHTCAAALQAVHMAVLLLQPPVREVHPAQGAVIPTAGQQVAIRAPRHAVHSPHMAVHH